MTDHIPGLGCGCDRCREPIPIVDPMTPAEAALRQSAYEHKRRDFQLAHGRTMDALGRGGKSG